MLSTYYWGALTDVLHSLQPRVIAMDAGNFNISPMEVSDTSAVQWRGKANPGRLT